MIHYAPARWERGRPRPQSLSVSYLVVFSRCGRGVPVPRLRGTMKTKLLVFVALTLFLLTSMNFETRADKSALVADIIIVNAKVHTMDRNQPTAEAVAIHRNRIVAVGATTDIKKLADRNTKVID